MELNGLAIFSYQLYRVVLSKIFGRRVYVDDHAVVKGLMNLNLERRKSYKDLVLTMSNVNSTNSLKGDTNEYQGL
jgi:hypothetical protein